MINTRALENLSHLANIPLMQRFSAKKEVRGIEKIGLTLHNSHYPPDYTVLLRVRKKDFVQ